MKTANVVNSKKKTIADRCIADKKTFSCRTNSKFENLTCEYGKNNNKTNKNFMRTMHVPVKTDFHQFSVKSKHRKLNGNTSHVTLGLNSA